MALSTVSLSTVSYFLVLVPVFLSDEEYAEYRRLVGAELTMAMTFFYIHPMFTLLLMTINRIGVVLSMQAAQYFTYRKIWIYTFMHMIFHLICLLIPYFSECRITFNLRIPAYQSGCAPKRHPITQMFNKYSIFLPFIAFALNLMIIINFKLQRSTFYKNCLRRIRGESKIVAASSIPDDVRRAKKKTERMLMIQSFVTAFYLSTFELINLVARIHPV
ncbi:unnamed protein product [Caenorhabditis bovis]|uniref:Uncharacterized protein n=1 Tax=Caenorhabditis bovis TaxID=2654633 RepID=A0A8S1EGN9_9PELO|nr:unnamed protein product [Caenorhabditis bovis]